MTNDDLMTIINLEIENNLFVSPESFDSKTPFSKMDPEPDSLDLFTLMGDIDDQLGIITSDEERSQITLESSVEDLHKFYMERIKGK